MNFTNILIGFFFFFREENGWKDSQQKHSLGKDVICLKFYKDLKGHIVSTNWHHLSKELPRHGCSLWWTNANGLTSTQLALSVTEKDSSGVGWINELRYRSTLTGKDPQHTFSEILNNRSCLYFSCYGSNRELVSQICLRYQEWHVTQRPVVVSKAPSYTARYWKHVWSARFTGSVVHFFFRLTIKHTIHLNFSTKTRRSFKNINLLGFYFSIY